MRQLLMVGPVDWRALGVSPSDWPDCQVTETAGVALAIRLMATRAFDVLVTNPATSIVADQAIVAEPRRLQPGLRTIVLAPAFTPADIIQALRAQVFACLTMPCPAEELRYTVRQALDHDDERGGIEVLSAVPHWIALRVACRRVTADRLSRFMNELAGGLPASDRFALVTAFREILLNAMEHGAGFDPDKVVDVFAVRTKRTIVYYFKDPGPGFNVKEPGAVATDTDPIGHMALRDDQGLRPGGFGMLMARKLVDEVFYNEPGNEVVLIKHLV